MPKKKVIIGDKFKVSATLDFKRKASFYAPASPDINIISPTQLGVRV